MKSLETDGKLMMVQSQAKRWPRTRGRSRQKKGSGWILCGGETKALKSLEATKNRNLKSIKP